MSDPNELAALKTAFRGALQTADALSALRDRVESLESHADLGGNDLEDLARVTAAHAIASAALRGLFNTMLARRGAAEQSR
jgi:hypothetical protein